MRTKKETYKSKVYTDRSAYADFDAPSKFNAIKSIIAKRLVEFPNAICSYSGGSDSDIMLHMIEEVRKCFELPSVAYCFFNTGLEMEVIKRHVKDMGKLYGVTIIEHKPKKNIIQSARACGVPFISKIASRRLGLAQKYDVPFSIAHEYENSVDKTTKLQELIERYPNCKTSIIYLCNCDSRGNPINSQLTINSQKYLLDFMIENPPQFNISANCCDHCKKHVAKKAEKNFDMVITGERYAEGGQRAASNSLSCFTQAVDGKYRLRPLYYVSDADKQWYKDYYKIRYSDAYEVYGLKRTGCCGCPISSKAADDLEKIRPFEPNLVKAAWHVFGDSYRYRERYNEYKAQKRCKAE